MRRSEVEQWLNDNGGQKDYQVVEVEIPNPRYNKQDRNSMETIKVPKVTWIAANGKRLTVIDDTAANPQPSSFSPIPADPNSTSAGTPMGYDPVYRVLEQGDDPKDDPKPVQDTRTAEQKRAEAEEEREKQWNQANGGLYETHAARRARERQDKLDQDAAAERARVAASDAARRQLEKDQFDFGVAKDARDAEIARRREEADNAERARRAGIDEKAEARATRAEERTNATPLGPMTEDQEYIARYNPETKQIEQADNPIYNRLKAEAQKKKEQLATAIQLRLMDQKEAESEYARWYKENVETPILLATERRAQSAEQRAALAAEEQRRQFKSSNDIARANVGQQGANMMLDAEMALNPYRVGPAFGEQMSSAINSLGAGGKMDANAAAGVNFTADAFEYKKPDLEKIARKGTKAALKGLTPYDPDDAKFQTANYSGLNMPSASTMQGAPTPGPSPYNIPNLYEQLYGSTPYQYNAQSARA